MKKTGAKQCRERAAERKVNWFDIIELSDNMVAYCRNGKIVIKHFSDEWMFFIVKLIEAICDKNLKEV